MSTLTMPTLMVAFQQRANTAVARSQKGTVAFVIRDAAANSADQTYALASTGQIPKTLGTANQDAVRRVFQGSPKKVLLYVMGAEAVISAQSPLLTWLETQKFDYLAGPDDLTAEEAAALKKWVVEQRSDNSAIYKAVLPDTVADSEAIVNFCAQEILAGGETFTAAAYCGRIAGLIAGTPMTQSVTYAALAEVEDIHRMTPVEMDAAVGAGKLILYHDGEKVKLGRGVNQDIRLTIQDKYIGKVSNSYDNKLQLVTAIKTYLQSLARDGLIEADFTVDIDLDSQRAWLESQGTPTVDLSDQQVRQANTGTQVFLVLDVKPIDAMEDVRVVIRV